MRHHPRPLEEQVIVLTGASSGIGLATARMLARQGASVVLASRNDDALAQLSHEINERGGRATHYALDTADAEAVAGLARHAIQEFGRIDTWINNAAISIYGRLDEVPLNEHRRLFETNYWGYVHGSLEALKHMRDRGGTLINIGSVLSDRSIPMQGPYCATKHAVKGFTDSLRMEIMEEHLPVNVCLIKPSAIDTPYKDHAKNYMETKPKNPPPVYHPHTVARAVVSCCENPRRSVVVGFGGRAVSTLGMISPSLTDLIMNHTMSWLQTTNKPPAPRDQHSLFEPKGKTLQERGEYPDYVPKTSAYTQARLHPLVTTALLGAAAVAASWWLMGESGERKGREPRRKRPYDEDGRQGELFPQRAATMRPGEGI